MAETTTASPSPSKTATNTSKPAGTGNAAGGTETKPKAAPKAKKKGQNNGQGRSPYEYCVDRIVAQIIKPDLEGIIRSGVTGKGDLLAKFKKQFPTAAVSNQTLNRWIEMAGLDGLFDNRVITLPAAAAPASPSTTQG